ncbi:MAG: preprotein translocase subunit SecG [Spirochaetaceae bacterium]|jgi:preprotein translocase subunit SecG|nr:preprotein translocase subunit SecG [Spirochaetaceae bacterium]
MSILNVLLLVFFVIVAVLLVLLVLIQNEEGDSLGGIFAGGSGSAFGSRSGNVLTRTTTILGALFLVLCLSLALINRTSGAGGVEAAGRQLDTGGRSDWWQDDEAPQADGAAPEIIFDGLNDAAPAPEILQEEVPAGETAAE